MLEPGEFSEILRAEDVEKLRTYAEHLLAPNADRTLILTAHLIAERLLGDMIATRLSSPEVWLKEADFRSRTNLARALGLIGDDELNICRVLNSARNHIAHDLDPLPETWTVEIQRLASTFKRDSEQPNESPGGMEKCLMDLIITLSAPWFYVMFHTKHRTLVEENEQRWMEIMKEKLRARSDRASLLQDVAEREKLVIEVDVALTRELQAKSKTKH